MSQLLDEKGRGKPELSRIKREQLSCSSCHMGGKQTFTCCSKLETRSENMQEECPRGSLDSYSRTVFSGRAAAQFWERNCLGRTFMSSSPLFLSVQPGYHCPLSLLQSAHLIFLAAGMVVLLVQSALPWAAQDTYAWWGKEKIFLRPMLNIYLSWRV